jgi:chaperonin GroES
MVNVRPQGNRVLVQPIKNKTSKGGIILPDTAQEKPKEGVVLNVGPGKTDEQGRQHPVSVKKGDQVVFSAYSGTEFKMDGEEYLIISEDDLLGTLN